MKYQVERGLDVAIGEYAPGRAIVVDKTTYQIGGLYHPGGDRSARTAATPARSFIRDASYRKTIRTCGQCGWFGLEEDHHEFCPFCGNSVLTNMLPMLRPWGFAPRNAASIETAQLNEEYTATQQPLYSTLPDADDVTDVDGCAKIRMAVRPNQRIIMLNKGVNDKGFTICCDCGAAMPGDDPVVLKDSVLDRKAALDLLRWGETGIRVPAIPHKNQRYLLQSLEQILQISGAYLDIMHDSVWAEGRHSKKKVVVYPAMWTKPTAENTIFVSDAQLKYAKPYALKTILDSL